MSGPEGHNPFHNIVVKYRIWTAHSGEKKADIYCVTQEITLFNQDLKCGPSDKYKWYDGREWGPWKELEKKSAISVKILQMAGKVAGVSSGGSYTIVWRQTDFNVNSDREEFAFNMN